MTRAIGLLGGGGLALLLAMAPASASPTCTTTSNLGSGGLLFSSSLTSGSCVKVDNIVYGDFHLGNLPTSTVLAFNTTNSAGIDSIQLSFTSTWHSGTTYNWSYEVAVATGSPSGTVITQLDSDFDQTKGQSTLDKTTNPAGDHSIHLFKIANVLQPGSVSVSNFGTGITDFVISEQLQDHGTVGDVTNTVSVSSPTPNTPVPEPATLMLLGAGLAGLGTMRRRKKTG